MELRDDLYMVKGERHAGDVWQCIIALNADCAIYQAHFPGEPVTPGACLLQIARELLESHLHTSLVIVYIKDVKFMSVISPVETSEVLYSFSKIDMADDGQVKARVMVTAGDKSFCSISFTCKKR